MYTLDTKKMNAFTWCFELKTECSHPIVMQTMGCELMAAFFDRKRSLPQIELQLQNFIPAKFTFAGF